MTSMSPPMTTASRGARSSSTRREVPASPGAHPAVEPGLQHVAQQHGEGDEEGRLEMSAWTTSSAGLGTPVSPGE